MRYFHDEAAFDEEMKTVKQMLKKRDMFWNPIMSMQRPQNIQMLLRI